MPSYFVGINHTNSTDDPESIAKVVSTEVEKKKVKSIHIFGMTNAGYLRPFIEREGLVEGIDAIPTATATIQNEVIIPIDHDIPAGQTFDLMLQNVVSGVNAAIQGYVEYEMLA